MKIISNLYLPILYIMDNIFLSSAIALYTLHDVHANNLIQLLYYPSQYFNNIYNNSSLHLF